jgi:hypothetical protein
MQFLQHKLLNRFFICIYLKNTTDLCVIKEFIFGLQYETHVPQYLAQFLVPRHPLYLFIIALISSVTLPSAEGRICNTLSKNSVECQ